MDLKVKIKNFFSLSLSRSKNRRRIVGVATTLGVVLICYGFLLAPPADFPASQVVKIRKGTPLASITKQLQEKNVVRSPSLFYFVIRFCCGDEGVMAGTYYLEKRLSLFPLIGRLVRGNFDPAPYKVTIPEGATNAEIAKIIAKKIPGFDEEKFLSATNKLEGRLFPDTYFFTHGSDEADVVEKMVSNFEDQIRDLQTVIAGTGHSLDEIIVMASLIEKEAYKEDDRQMISGVLWKRIEQDMPLQVDAVFPYIIGKNTYELTKADLKIDSPYNTYKYKGLPPGPIANPSLSAIKAAIYPKDNPYLYYLSDGQGKMHYALNYKEHLQNVDLYLN